MSGDTILVMGLMTVYTLILMSYISGRVEEVNERLMRIEGMVGIEDVKPQERK